MTLLSRDPDAAWKNFGPFIMNETVEYGRGKRPGVPRPHDACAESINALCTRTIVEILNPDEPVGQIDWGRTAVVMNPLIGGLPLEAGWASLRLFGDEVLPAVGHSADIS